MYPPVLDKADFVRRYQLGEFGNHAPTWNTLGEFLRSGYRGKVHLRNREAAGKGWYDVDARVVEQVWEEAIKEVCAEDLYVSGMAPHDRGTIQGEVLQACYGSGGAGVDLTYTSAKLPMRDAMAISCEHVSGILAVSTLRSYMDANSYEWLQVLLERYPGHCVEFSCFEIPWGTLWPNYNTITWEVRRY